MTRYRALIFDLDGTLCDSRLDITNAVNHARTSLGLEPISVDEVTGHVGDGMTRLLQRSFAGRPDLVEAARPLFMDHYSRHLADNTTVYDGVAEGLRALEAAGQAMAVLTNKPQEFSRRLLDRFGLLARFRLVVGGDTFPTRKPDPQGALAIAEALDAEPAATLIVGDNHTDLVTARHAGMHCVYCTYGFGRRQGEHCDYSAPSFCDVVGICLGRA